MTTDVDKVLDERGSRYGTFEGHAIIAQSLKMIVRTNLVAKNKVLKASQQEALDMIMHKVARIINGDPNYADSWIDIAGYAKLIADELDGNVR